MKNQLQKTIKVKENLTSHSTDEFSWSEIGPVLRWVGVLKKKILSITKYENYILYSGAK